MKPYDPNASCPKCGHDYVETGYEEACHWATADTLKRPAKEHLRRTCGRCGFNWPERCFEQANDAGWCARQGIYPSSEPSQ